MNVGDYKWTYIPAYLPKEEERFLESDEAYGVRILRKSDEYELRVNFEIEYKLGIGFEKGSIGVDFNHKTIDLAVTNKQGQLKDIRTLNCYALTSARKGKRECLIKNLAKNVVDYAKYWNRGLVIEELNGVTRSQSNQHEFAYLKFLKAVKRRAERESVAVKEVNPAYTSVIGQYKYAPYYHITVHQAAALVIARRGQGLSEKLRGLKTLLTEPMEGGSERENALSHRVHSWCLWRLMRDLPSRKGTEYKHSGRSPEMIGVENSRTSIPTERSSDAGDASGGEIVIPGSGPPCA